MPIVQERECEACGGRFKSESPRAKYCSSRCRQRGHRVDRTVPARIEGAQVLALLPKPTTDRPAVTNPPNGLYASTLARLEAADRVESPDGQAALLLAQIADSPGGNTAASIAAVVREHRASLAAALDGVVTEEDPLAGRQQELHALRVSV